MFKRKGRRSRKMRSGGDSSSAGSSIASLDTVQLLSSSSTAAAAVVPPGCLRRSWPHDSTTANMSVGDDPEEGASRGSGGSKNQRPRPLNVRFQIVQIREFERIIGDNPSCSSGAPIGYVIVVVARSASFRLF